MAERGLVFDLEHKGQRYVALAPVVIGFFEFTLCAPARTTRAEELARALRRSTCFEDEDFARAVFAGQTQIGRALVREEALPQGDHTEVLDWERACDDRRDGQQPRRVAVRLPPPRPAGLATPASAPCAPA